MNTTFYMHCGAQALDRNQLVELPEPPPKTDTWQPIRHAELVTQVESALLNQGMRVVEQAHAVAAKGNRYFGMLQVARAETLEVQVQGDTALAKRAEYAYVVGLRNSHDKSFPAGLVVGPYLPGVFGHINFPDSRQKLQKSKFIHSVVPSSAGQIFNSPERSRPMDADSFGSCMPGP